MESLFFLSPEARLYFLRTEAQTLGCAYICLWYYLPQPSNCLISMDGWYNEDEGQPSSSSGSYKKKLFEDYKGSVCSADSGCVPGLVFKQKLPYIELEDFDLLNSASSLAQLEFYKEAGIKKAVFIGCGCGEIELGSLTSTNANIQMLFNNDFINFQRSQIQLGELYIPAQNILSSSSTSSLKSLSIGSPEYTSLLPSPQSADAVLTRALMAVFSGTDPQQQEKGSMNLSSSSFEPYDSILASFESSFRSEGQKMMKKCISLLRNVHALKYAAARMHDKPPMSSSKLHHVIAERKRRVRISESLRDLRMLLKLPPGTKKDHVTVLSKTKDYLNTLKVQIKELQEKNRKLEMQLKSTKQAVPLTASNERVEVQVIKVSESQQINILIIVREEMRLIDLLLKVLDCLKAMGIVNLTTIDASSSPTMSSLTLQVQQAFDWDVDSLKQTLTMAILDSDKDNP